MSDFMKLDSVRLEQAGKGQADSGMELSPPKGADIDAFNRAMGEKPKPEGQNAFTPFSAPKEQPQQPVQDRLGREGEKPTGQTPPSAMPRTEKQEGRRSGGESGSDGGEQDGQNRQKMDSPLNQLFSQMSNPLGNLFPARVPDVVPTEGASVPHDIGEIADRLVERILVSQPADGTSEIRIKLGNDVLPDTEIRMLRAPDGRLEIRLETQNTSVFQTLVGAQDTLKGQLERVEKNVMVMVVSERNGADAESGDSRQRSRGQYVDEDEQGWR